MGSYLLGFVSSLREEREAKKPALEKLVTEAKERLDNAEDQVELENAKTLSVKRKLDSALKAKKLAEEKESDGLPAQVDAAAELLLELQAVATGAANDLTPVANDLQSAIALAASSASVLVSMQDALKVATASQAAAQLSLQSAVAGGNSVAIAAAEAALALAVAIHTAATGDVEIAEDANAVALEQLAAAKALHLAALSSLLQAEAAVDGCRAVLASFASINPLELQTTFSNSASMLLARDAQLAAAMENAEAAETDLADKQAELDVAMDAYTSALSAYDDAVSSGVGVAEASAAIALSAAALAAAQSAADAASGSFDAATSQVSLVTALRAQDAAAFARAQAALTTYELHRSTAQPTTGRPDLVIGQIAVQIARQTDILLKSKLAAAANKLLYEQLLKALEAP